MPFGLILAPFDLTKEISGTPLNLNFWRTNIELSRIRSTGACQFHARNGQSMKLNASEGNEPRKASSPLPFREAINKFVGNLSVTQNLIKQLLTD